MSHHLNPAEIKHQKRCTWAESNALMQAYHDTEWGSRKETLACCGKC